MSKPSEKKKPRDGFNDMDMDMESGLSVFRPSSTDTQEVSVPPTPAPKKKKKPQPKVKEGLYFSAEVSDRLDKLWKKQPKGGLSKSIIVENILREKWGMDSLTD